MRSVIRSFAAGAVAITAFVVSAGPASAHTAYLEVSAECPETAGGPWTVSWTARSWTTGEAGSHPDVRLQIDEDAYPANSGWVAVEFFSFPVQDTVPVVTGTYAVDGELDEVAFRLFTNGNFGDGSVPLHGGWTEPVFVSQPTDCEGGGSTTTSTSIGGSTTTSTSIGGSSTTSTSVGGSSTTVSTTASTDDTTSTTEELGVLPSDQTAPPAIGEVDDVDGNTEVEGAQVQRSPGQAGGALARTGADSGPTVLLGVLLAAAGSAAVATAGRLRRRSA
jgi:hypothetical protein